MLAAASSDLLWQRITLPELRVGATWLLERTRALPIQAAVSPAVEIRTSIHTKCVRRLGFQVLHSLPLDAG